MKLLLSVFATMVLLHVVHSYSLHDTASNKKQQLLDELQSTSQQEHEDEMVEMVRERVRKLRDYNRKTIAMLQEVQPRPRDASTQSSVELYSESPMGRPYFIPPDNYVYLDGIDHLLDYSLTLIWSASSKKEFWPQLMDKMM